MPSKHYFIWCNLLELVELSSSTIRVGKRTGMSGADLAGAQWGHFPTDFFLKSFLVFYPMGIEPKW